MFQITNLKRIRTDPNYQELRELHAENNQIVSLHEIEASNFIKNFQMLDIRANRLTEVRFRFYQVLKLYSYDNYSFLDCVSLTIFRILWKKNKCYVITILICSPFPSPNDFFKQFSQDTKWIIKLLMSSVGFLINIFEVGNDYLSICISVLLRTWPLEIQIHICIYMNRNILYLRLWGSGILCYVVW
jgi:hypothetical protein